jgi:hypothetical protein
MADSDDPYTRGVAHLKRSEYAAAVAALTEAIRRDPTAANAYVGRGLAYRGLEDDAAAARDEAAAKSLGGPDRSAWDRLVKQGLRRWKGDLADPVWTRDDPVTRDAVLLRHWTWQIYNGGLPQWVANGFAAWADDLATACDRIETASARGVAAIVRKISQILRARPDARETMFRMIATQSTLQGKDDELYRDLAESETEYHWIAVAFGRDVDAHFERALSSG